MSDALTQKALRVNQKDIKHGPFPPLGTKHDYNGPHVLVFSEFGNGWRVKKVTNCGLYMGCPVSVLKTIC